MAWTPLDDRTNKYNNCYGCKERKLGCHSTCEKYLADKAASEAIKENIRKNKQEFDDINGFLKDSAERGIKRYGDGRRKR